MEVRYMKKIIAVLLVLAMSISLVACGTEEEQVLKMGFVPMMDGDTLIESVEPLTDMLSEELGVKVEGFTATNYVGVVEGLGSGQVDFGFIPPFAYVLANQESGAEVILTAVKKNGKTSYKSAFLVREDSDIEDFEDIRGKKLAFVDPSSTSGYLFPGAHLINEGIDIESDIEYVNSGGHDKSLQLLLNGDVDVISVFSEAPERYKEDFPDALEKTRVLGYTKDIPGVSVTVKSDMEAELRQKIEDALIKIADTEEGEELLSKLFNMYGFQKATDDDYEVIRSTAKTMNIDLKEAD
jgi:phosphonate transport system substrate-binding protein